MLVVLLKTRSVPEHVFFILIDFWRQQKYNLKKWKTFFNPETYKFKKVSEEIIDAKTNKIVVKSGSKINFLQAQKLYDKGLKEILVSNEAIIGRFLHKKITLNIDEKELKKRITKKTKAIMLIHVLGNSANMKTIMKIKKKYNLILVEDTCESFGSLYEKNYLGSFGDFSSFSFYTSHQISAGEGGVVCCKNSEDYEIIKSLRSHGWTRNLNIDSKIKFNKKYLDKKFLFYNSGFNLRPTEISAIIARNQISKHGKANQVRNQNRLKIIKL